MVPGRRPFFFFLNKGSKKVKNNNIDGYIVLFVYLIVRYCLFA